MQIVLFSIIYGIILPLTNLFRGVKTTNRYDKLRILESSLVISRWFLELHLESIWIYTACNFPRWIVGENQMRFSEMVFTHVVFCMYTYHICIYTYVHLLMYQPVSGRFKYIATKLPTLDANSAFFSYRHILTLLCYHWVLKVEVDVNAILVWEQCECRTCRGGKHWRSKWMHLSPVETWRPL